MHLLAIGGSDAGISAALRARELDPNSDVTVVVSDSYPNFSICGIPYYISGEVPRWQNLAHRTVADLETTGMNLCLDTKARAISPEDKKVVLEHHDGREELLSYDALVIGTGAVPVRPPIEGISGPDALGVQDGVHLLHSMGDTFDLMSTLEKGAHSVAIVGAGYIGLEMAEGLIRRGAKVTQIEQLPEVLPTVDAELGAIVRAELENHGVEVVNNTIVRAIRRTTDRRRGRLLVETESHSGPRAFSTDVVLVVTGVRPDSDLAAATGVELGVKGAIAVDRHMHTNVPEIFAAGDCAVTYHRILGNTYLPLGTTAHKQGRIAAENALGNNRQFEGSLGTQVVRVFDVVAARTGLRDDEATAVGFRPLTVASDADDHKAYYPGAHKIAMRYCGDANSGRLLGLQLVGRLGTEVAKRVDVAATAIFNEMRVDQVSDVDLSYSPPLGSPWDALQIGAQAWERVCRRAASGTA
jgi:NADPH-dependent 2,4-dienoyl-CoA reductase/sulfur reductase-like enzyme